MCKECVRTADAERRARDPVKAREQDRQCKGRIKLRDPTAWRRAQKDTQLRMTYGISIDVYDRMLAGQNGLCRICGKPETNAGFSLAVDHCHKTGTIRGLLCCRCNHVLGLMGDDPKLLRVAALYVEVPRYVSAS